MGKHVILMLIIVMIGLMVLRDGVASGSNIGMDVDLGDSSASFIGESAGDRAGLSVASAGDVNGDGYDDILIGALDNDEGGMEAGQAYLFFGRSTGWSMDTDLSTADASFIGEAADDRVGGSVAGVGDVNGDGFDDFIISAVWNDEAGYAAGQTYLILGKPSGWSMDVNLANADASFLGESLNDDSGHWVAGAGDVNGDTFDDILIGAHENDEGGSRAGQTYLIFGKPSGWSMDTDLAVADASFVGEYGDDYSGSPVSGLGDVNGDDFDDFLIGAKWNDEGGSQAGQTYLFLGKGTGWSMDTDLADADASFIGEKPGDYSGWGISGAGDVNGDGLDDILIGAITNGEMVSEAGQTYLILGKTTGWSMDTDLADADASFWGENARDHSGISTAGVGDVNQDGFDDILIGALRNDEGATDGGQTYLIFGKRSGWALDTRLSNANASFLGEGNDDLSGYAVAGAGDVNGDGSDDILIGALYNDEGGWDAGQVYLVLGDSPIAWGPLPVLEATEDIPLTVDFSGNVTGSSAHLGDLSIESDSPYVTAVSGLNVTFLFDEGVTEAMVLLQLRDGDLSVTAQVRFRVLPVNDPPSHCIPPVLGATEDIPFALDLAIYVWDVDNPVSDLSLTIEDDMVSAEGFVISALFPNGVLEHRVTGVLTDGLATTEVVLVFDIVPVDDHFTMDLPYNITIIEDRPYVFDLALYITDEDSPLEDLSIRVSNIHYGKQGTILTFFEERGGMHHNAKIEVFEGHRDYGYIEYLSVYVQEVNDAPVVDAVPDVRLAEHMTYRLELGRYVSDEETAPVDLSLVFNADDPSARPPLVVAVDGLNLTLRYEAWEPPHALRLGVTDGDAITWVDVAVEVVDENDAPTVSLPGSVSIDEGTEIWLDMGAWDEDGEELLYYVESTFHGVEAHDNGTLRFWARRGEVGHYVANVSVMDVRGAGANVTLQLEVRNVNDPPDVPVVLAPLDGSVQVSGAIIAFDVEVGDPDTRFGQVLTVTWTSDLEGELAQLRSDQVMNFTRSLDIPGTHRVTVTVDDGEYQMSATIVVEVREPRPEGPADGRLHVWLAVVAVTVVTGLYLYRMRREKM